MTDSKIIYTYTDEAPLLATYSFLPIIAAYAAKAGVDVETGDDTYGEGHAGSLPSSAKGAPPPVTWWARWAATLRVNVEQYRWGWG